MEFVTKWPVLLCTDGSASLVLYAGHPLMMRVFTISSASSAAVACSEGSFCHWKLEGKKKENIYSTPCNIQQAHAIQEAMFIPSVIAKQACLHM